MNDLQAKIADPNVGVIGVLQILSDTIRSKTAPDGQVAIDTFYKNADASNALREAYGALTGRSGDGRRHQQRCRAEHAPTSSTDGAGSETGAMGHRAPQG